MSLFCNISYLAYNYDRTVLILSKLKKTYYIRFLQRVFLFICAICIYFNYPSFFDILHGFTFFEKFNVLHIFYIVWLADIAMQLMPMTGQFSIGSLKQFPHFMKEIKDDFINHKILSKKQIKNNVGALIILFIWILLTVSVGLLRYFGIINDATIFMICCFFYVCDLICVLFFCPFQKWFMKNKCCATCRIFNWDHMMMFSCFIFVPGFYGWSLVLLSLTSMFIWEFNYLAHSERFFEETNATLKCKNCKDKMCRKNLRQ